MMVYIAGPMTGLPGHNFQRFHEVANDFRRQGYEVMNPAENFNGATDLPRQIYMRRDMSVLTHVDGIVLLEGWEDSKGARLEVLMAQEMGIPFFTPEGDPFDGDLDFRARVEIRSGKATLRPLAAPAACGDR